MEITELDLQTKISCLAYDMEDLETKLKTVKSRIAKKLLTMRLEAMRLEHGALCEQYNMGNYIMEEDDRYPLYDEEMIRANEAIDACYDI
jgi:hypothetical protein